MFAVVAAISIVLSVTYNIGFYFIISDVFFKFLSIQDHLVAALTWLVVGLPLTSLIYLLFSFCTSKCVENKKNGRIKLTLIGVFSMLLGMNANAIYSDFDKYNFVDTLKNFETVLTWVALLILCYVFFLPNIYKLVRKLLSGGIFEAYAISLLIPMMGISYVFGIAQAIGAIADCQQFIKKVEPKEMLLPIASNEKGVIFFGPTCNIGFTTWDELKSVGEKPNSSLSKQEKK